MYYGCSCLSLKRQLTLSVNLSKAIIFVVCTSSSHFLCIGSTSIELLDDVTEHKCSCFYVLHAFLSFNWCCGKTTLLAQLCDIKWFRDAYASYYVYNDLTKIVRCEYVTKMFWGKKVLIYKPEGKQIVNERWEPAYEILYSKLFVSILRFSQKNSYL